MKRFMIFVTTVIAIGSLCAYMGFRYARVTDKNGLNTMNTVVTDVAQALYWYDPMRPDQHFDQPGKSPFMDMQLVAKYATPENAMASTDQTKTIAVSATAIQNLGLRTDVVQRKPFIHHINASAVVLFNERLATITQARRDAIVEHTYTHAVGDWLPAFTPLADLRIPEWTAAQQEWLSLQNDNAMRDAASARLRALGMNEIDITRLAETQQAERVFTLKTERSGVLQQWSLRAGMVIEKGQTLAMQNSYDSVWLDIALTAGDSLLVHENDHISVQWPAAHTPQYEAVIESLLPVVDANSRTLTARARIALPSQHLRLAKTPLRPGNFAQVVIESHEALDVLQIPSDAVITTGTRSVVMRAVDAGHFEPVAVDVGREANGWSEIRSGLHEGERVVVSGQFLIDSEASLRGLMQKIDGDKTTDDRSGSVVTP